MRTKIPSILCVLCALCGFNFPVFGAEKTNVVFILTDNHGAWTLGCYGNPDIKTPHIDQLAAEGVRFSHAFANNAVCSPTRATYLTGLMPSQHGVHSFLSGGGLQTGPEARNTLEEFTSLPEILKKEGYRCGLVGKWHLGANESPQEGLEDYWITMPHGGTSTFHGAKVIENGETRTEPKYLTDLWTEHACKFIEENKEEPFFLYLAFNGPYGLSRYQLEPSGNRHTEYYADKPMDSFPRGAIHPWQYPNREYFGNMTSIRRYGEELSAVDDGVGAVMQKLKDCGIEGETLVIFAADQGWAGGQHGLWGMGDHTRPVNAREYSMQIPMIFRHVAKGGRSGPGIPGGRVSDLLVSNYDFVPSVLNYLGMGARNPGPASASPATRLPGRDFSPVLRGEEVSGWDDTVFYEFETLRCVRTRDWKYVERYAEGYDELYDLKADPGERNNLFGDEKAAGKTKELQARLVAFFDEHAGPKYDLWKGGTSQAQLHAWGKEAAARHSERATRFGTMASVIDPEVDVPPMSMPVGLVAEVAAAPPLTRHPMMASFDERGRLFIAEAAGVNMTAVQLDEATPNFIRMLTDTNGDGLFDEATVFADKLTFPSGALWHEGALWVTAAPNIWRLEDADDDGVADKREIIASGFGYTGNAADLHGPFLHPNGRIFWVHGRKDLDVFDKDGNSIHKGKGARVWSCEPDGSDVAVFAGGGMDNPVEIDFTPEGEIVGSVNLFHGRPRGDTLVHWQYGGAYPRHDQGAVLEEFTKTGELLPEIYDFGHVAVSGMMLQRSASGVGGKAGDLYTSFFNTQKIVRSELVAEGPTFRTVRHEEFLSIDDPDAHLTDVLEDADGSLLVIDTGGWFRNGCPMSQIAKPEVAGAIYRIRRAGIYPEDPKADPRGMGIEWGTLETVKVAALLGDERYAVCERAIGEMAARGEESLGELEKVLRGGTVEAKRNAVWALTRIGTKPAMEIARRALLDEEASVRHTACNGIWRTRDPGAVEALSSLLLKDESLPVQVAAARALGRIGDARAVEPLLEFAGRDLDRSREHAAIYALIEIGDVSSMSKFLSNANGIVISRLLWAIHGTSPAPGEQLSPEGFVSYLGSEIEEVRRVAVAICKEHPDWGDAVAAHFGAKAGYMPAMEELLPVLIESARVQELIGRLCDGAEEKALAMPLSLIAKSNVKVPLNESWIGGLERALSSSDREVLEAGLAALGKIAGDHFDDRLKEISDDEGRSSVVRVKAIAALSGGTKPLSNGAFALLKGVFASGGEPTRRVEAASLLAEARLTTAQRVEVAGLLRDAGPVELETLFRVFERTKDPGIGMALVAGLADCRALGAIRPTELSRVLLNYPPEVVAAAEPLLEEMRARAAEQAERMTAMEERLEAGDAGRGKTAFVAGKGACVTCHQVGEIGRAVGPDLSRIGRIRTKRDLLESVLYPSSSLARDFEPFELVMADGQVRFGIIQEETADTVFLVDATGIAQPVARSGIAEIRPGAFSMMPAGLEQAMTPEELVDIVAYLDSLE